jgi:hypothetical protein
MANFKNKCDFLSKIGVVIKLWQENNNLKFLFIAHALLQV